MNNRMIIASTIFLICILFFIIINLIISPISSSVDDCFDKDKERSQEFISKLNERTETHPPPLPGGEFRLPSEAEWEYAGRAGTDTMFYFSNEVERLREYAWYYKNSEDSTHPVGQLKPNAKKREYFIPLQELASLFYYC